MGTIKKFMIAGLVLMSLFPAVSFSASVCVSQNGDTMYTAGVCVNPYQASIKPFVDARIAQALANLEFPEHSSASSTEAEMFADGMAMGWGVVYAMFASFAVIFLIRAFFK